MTGMATLPIALGIVSRIMGAPQGLTGLMPPLQEPTPPAPPPQSPIVQRAFEAQIPTGFRVGGRLYGPGDGMSDDIPATIDGVEPARVASGEHVLDASFVSDVGNGDTEAGHRAIEQAKAQVRKARHGTTKQPPALKKGLASLFMGK